MTSCEQMRYRARSEQDGAPCPPITPLPGSLDMTKAELVAQVADAIGPGVTKRDCALVVDAFLNAVKRAMQEDDHIEIRGFGTFKVQKRKSRMARNPRTGEPVKVPERMVPVFKPSRKLRTKVDRSVGSSPA